MVFGKVDVAEPAFDILLQRSASVVPYEIRSYGKRFAIEASYTGKDEQKTPFMMLAGYIGVVGKPQNEGSTEIAMTAPVVMESRKTKENQGTAIAMTAPVVMHNDEKVGSKTMQFILPAEYDEMSKIPKPTKAGVVVKELAPEYGAVHRYSGTFNDEKNKKKALELGKQLVEDGLSMRDEEILEKFQFWGFNPPFTIPFLRRNEIFISLSKKQVDDLVKKFEPN